MKSRRALSCCSAGILLSVLLLAAVPATAQQEAPDAPLSVPCPSECRPVEGEALVYCDTGLLEEWPEYEFIKELELRLSDSTCNAAGIALQEGSAKGRFDLFVSLAADTQGSVSHTFEDTKFQLYGRRAELEITSGFDVEQACTFVEVALPRQSTSLNNLFQDEDEFGKASAASQLIEFIFIPRIFQDDKDVGMTPEERPIYIAPATAVPSRLLDDPEGVSNLPINLREVARRLEPIGLQFITILQRSYYHRSVEGKKRLARELKPDGSIPPALPYVWDELRYFELVLKRELESEYYSDPAELSGAAAEGEDFEYVRRFIRFWKSMDERAQYVKAQEKNKRDDLFSIDQ